MRVFSYRSLPRITCGENESHKKRKSRHRAKKLCVCGGGYKIPYELVRPSGPRCICEHLHDSILRPKKMCGASLGHNQTIPRGSIFGLFGGAGMYGPLKKNPVDISAKHYEKRSGNKMERLVEASEEIDANQL